MNATDSIKQSMETADMISLGYLNDLTDAEMFKRPFAKCNHINWQVGHLICSEHMMISSCCPDSMPPLPAGFAEKYEKETSNSDDPTQFESKDSLLAVFQSVRTATLETLSKLSDQDLDKESPEPMRSYAPTVGAAFNMQAAHWLMHAGQWAVVRRQLGREPLF